MLLDIKDTFIHLLFAIVVSYIYSLTKLNLWVLLGLGLEATNN